MKILFKTVGAILLGTLILTAPGCGGGKTKTDKSGSAKSDSAKSGSAKSGEPTSKKGE